MDHQGVGMSWECASAGHGNCHQAGCRCQCHYRLGAAENKLAIDRVQTDINRVATPPMEDPLVAEMGKTALPVPNFGSGPVCPKCGMRGKMGDKFCRRDGTRIGLVYCGQCGESMTPEDAYCAGCGASLTAEIAVKQAVPTRRRSRSAHNNGDTAIAPENTDQ